MVVENNTVTMTTTTVYAEQATLPVHIIWIPYVVLIIVFVLGLVLSFRRHHVRQIKKRKYIVEYQEENLSARMPRIRGKRVDNLDMSCSHEGSLPSPCSSFRESALSDTGARPRVLNSDEVNLKFPSHGVKKRFKSTNELDTLPSLYRLLSEDEYFRRRGDRDSHYYLRCQSERNISPARHKHKVYDTRKSYWIRGDAKMTSAEEAVKYIKVFDLDLCDDCRTYVGHVNDKTSRADLDNISPSPHTEHVYIDMDPRVNQDPSSKEITLEEDMPSMTVQPSPEISIADVHPQPSTPFSSQFKPIYPNTTSTPCEIQLSPLYSERPRSAPDLSGETTGSDYFKLGVQESAFKVRPQFGFNLRRSPAEQNQRRTRGRDRQGVFWLDLDTYQHTLV